MNSKLINEIHSLLLSWFQDNKRDFPWRKEGVSLFEVLISEILLRKTKAEMVSDFFPKFIKKYPNFRTIYTTPTKYFENDLKPLGLNKTRAKIIKNLAYKISENYDNKIPGEFEQLIEFDGIGKYIAKAFLCFGMHKNEVLLDVNINRIFSRILNMKYPKKITNNHPLWKELEENISISNHISFFMALIDFGALVCKSKNFHCFRCPLIRLCNFDNKYV